MLLSTTRCSSASPTRSVEQAPRCSITNASTHDRQHDRQGTRRYVVGVSKTEQAVNSSRMSSLLAMSLRYPIPIRAWPRIAVPSALTTGSTRRSWRSTVGSVEDRASSASSRHLVQGVTRHRLQLIQIFRATALLVCQSTTLSIPVRVQAPDMQGVRPSSRDVKGRARKWCRFAP